MAGFLIDIAPGPAGIDRELLVIVALVVIGIAVVTVVALATGIFIFVRLRRSRAAADAGRESWATAHAGVPPEAQAKSPDAH